MSNKRYLIEISNWRNQTLDIIETCKRCAVCDGCPYLIENMCAVSLSIAHGENQMIPPNMWRLAGSAKE